MYIPRITPLFNNRVTLFFILIISFYFLFPGFGSAQQDTSVLDFPESLPYPLTLNCQMERHPGWTEDSVRQCGDLQLLSLIVKNIRYPAEAREKNIEGRVVVSFVVEPSGIMSNYTLLKDPGSGLGAEVIRILQAFQEAGLRWSPGKNSGQPVRSRRNFPVTFRLQEAPPFEIMETGDTVFVETDQPLGFSGGPDSLFKFLINRIEYPKAYTDSCLAGVIEMNVLVAADGTVKVLDQYDFNQLGSEFQWKALQLVNRTAGLWIPARYHDRAVPSAVSLRAVFKSPGKGCANANQKLDDIALKIEEASAFFENAKYEEALPILNQALEYQPKNTEVLYYRGTALLNLNRRDEACQDFNHIKKLLGVTWFESLRRVLCGW